MILDALHVMTGASGQAVTAAAATTDYIDFGAARDLGVGEVLYIVCICTVAMTDSSSDSTLEFKLQADAATDFNTVTGTQIVGTFAAVSAAGTRVVAKLQPEQINKRYVRGYFTPANGNLSAGTFKAFIVKDIQAYASYADGITIS